MPLLSYRFNRVFRAVCETKLRQFNVTDESPDCKEVSTPVCATETVDGVTEEVCRNVTTTKCEINSEQKDGLPETEVYEPATVVARWYIFKDKNPN
jgi:hypothetical protein